MGSFSIWHWLVLLAIILVLFGGGGKIPRLMKDLGQGITAFRKGLKEEKGAPEGEAQAKAEEKSQHSVIDRS